MGASAVLCLVATTYLSCVNAASFGFHTCPEYHYYDHGTDNCEHCRDICDKANYTNTMEECQSKCGPYALILWPPRPHAVPALGGSATTNTNTALGKGVSDHIPVAIVIAGLSVAVLVGLVFLVVFKRRIVVEKIRGCRRTPAVPPDPSTAAAERLRLEREENDAVPFIRQPDQTGVSVALAATLGSSSSTVGSAAAGIQEKGTACHEAEGNHSWHLLPRSGPSEFFKESLIPRVCDRVPQRTPVQVSPEGSLGVHVFALPSGPSQHSPNGQLGPGEGFNDAPDDHSTELKTLLPSLDEDSITRTCLGMSSSRV